MCSTIDLLVCAEAHTHQARPLQTG